MTTCKSRIETWDDPMSCQRVYAVKVPMSWMMRQKDRVGLTWLMLRLIWGIGATDRQKQEGE